MARMPLVLKSWEVLRGYVRRGTFKINNLTLEKRSKNVMTEIKSQRGNIQTGNEAFCVPYSSNVSSTASSFPSSPFPPNQIAIASSTHPTARPLPSPTPLSTPYPLNYLATASSAAPSSPSWPFPLNDFASTLPSTELSTGSSSASTKWKQLASAFQRQASASNVSEAFQSSKPSLAASASSKTLESFKTFKTNAVSPLRDASELIVGAAKRYFKERIRYGRV